MNRSGTGLTVQPDWQSCWKRGHYPKSRTAGCTRKRDRPIDLRVFRLDLHVHTVLSPCTELAEMTPRAIVAEALDKGLDMIAICDHNSARNAGATVRAAHSSRLTVVPGIEITSSEEVHFVGLFPTVESVEAVQEEVYSHLFGQNNEEVFGCQVVVDEHDQVEDLDQRLLISATTLCAEKVVNLIHRHAGIAVASHVDRGGFGIFSQLGFIPDTLELDALEVSKRMGFEAARQKYPQCRGYPLITSSDAHTLEDIGTSVTRAQMAEPSLAELRKALAQENRRRILEPE
jgi:3',5'-nucleoside bisphosphate phosphatase